MVSCASALCCSSLSLASHHDVAHCCPWTSSDSASTSSGCLIKLSHAGPAVLYRTCSSIQFISSGLVVLIIVFLFESSCRSPDLSAALAAPHSCKDVVNDCCCSDNFRTCPFNERFSTLFCSDVFRRLASSLEACIFVRRACPLRAVCYVSSHVLGSCLGRPEAVFVVHL